MFVNKVGSFAFREFSTSMSLPSIACRLKEVQTKVKAAAERRPDHLQYVEPRLLAVSKTKKTDLIIEVYDAGQRHFGENYVNELNEKGDDIEIQDRCADIKWHFIGHLQRNKVNKVLEVPNLFVVETIDSERLAKAVNDSWSRLKKPEQLNVMVQCNTSGEENKSGCSPEEIVKLAKFVREQCPCLKLIGLMTIGAYDHDYSKGPNPDFQALTKAREEVCSSLNLSIQDLELSMGMSGDFEHAIENGSTNVRVGTTIFGKRDKPATQDNGSKATPDSATEKMKDLSVN